jgi:hypothetical protein
MKYTSKHKEFKERGDWLWESGAGALCNFVLQISGLGIVFLRTLESAHVCEIECHAFLNYVGAILRDVE